MILFGLSCIAFAIQPCRVHSRTRCKEDGSDEPNQLISKAHHTTHSSHLLAALRESQCSSRSGPVCRFQSITALLLAYKAVPLNGPSVGGPALATCRSNANARTATHFLVMQPPRKSQGDARNEDPSKRRAWRKDMRFQVVKFAVPALSTVLADPLMSVIDGLCCGRFCTTLQLASLGPALAVFGSMNGLFFFLNAATTVRVTKLLANDDREAAAAAFSDAVFMAGACGLATSLILWNFAPQLIALTGCVPELIPPAAWYLRIRGIGHSIVLSSMVVQAGLLAQRDSITPMNAIFFACFVNVLGDLALVPRFGAAGAALATLVSEMLRLPLLLFLSAKRRRLPIQLRIPSLKLLMPLLSTSGPIFLFELGQSLNYMLIQSLGTQFSVGSTAAFQALWNPVNFLCFFCYPFKTVGPVFLPGLVKEETRIEGGAPKSREFLKVLTGIAFVSGLALAAIGAGFTMVPGVFTQDSTLWPEIRTFWPFVAAAIVLVPHAQAFEGVLLGAGDLRYLSQTQVLNVVTVVAGFFFAKLSGLGVRGGWAVLVAFYLSRVLQAALRVWVTRRPWKISSDTNTGS